MTGVAYSGSGDPFLYMLNNRQYIDVNSIVFVGTPIRASTQISTNKVETAVTIYGEKDWIFKGLNTAFRGGNFDGHLFENNERQINEIVIELKDVGHKDYFYDENNPGNNPELRQKASEFIARVTALANDAVALYQFLDTTSGIAKDASGRYEVDLERIVYNG